jgi:hypothetical protein
MVKHKKMSHQMPWTPGAQGLWTHHTLRAGQNWDLGICVAVRTEKARFHLGERWQWVCLPQPGDTVVITGLLQALAEAERLLRKPSPNSQPPSAVLVAPRGHPAVQLVEPRVPSSSLGKGLLAEPLWLGGPGQVPSFLTIATRWSHMGSGVGLTCVLLWLPQDFSSSTLLCLRVQDVFLHVTSCCLLYRSLYPTPCHPH